ncbi:hypothetical protein [Chitinophaga defluvii]|uniref:Gliding motility-associated lipoprotein GldH n=1 Tax=Chitinophaga defluvii TaxID=3163343 RepID=A0ABV2SZI3_9BACT
MRKLLLLHILLITGACLPIYAQTGKGKTTGKSTAPAQKKPSPKLRATWGIFLSDTLPRPEVLKLLDSTIVVRDQNNKKYPVIAFQFTYEQNEPYLNDTTGKPGVYKEFNGDNFKSNKLPLIWSNELKKTLQKGDVIYFDSIIVEYAEKDYYLAPKLKFEVR